MILACGFAFRVGDSLWMDPENLLQTLLVGVAATQLQSQSWQSLSLS